MVRCFYNESHASAVLFDLDGVLVDSRAPITGCINHALRSHGLPPREPETLLGFIGPPLSAAFAELTGQPRDSPIVLSCIEAYRARYADVSLRETRVVPGIVRVLRRLRERYRLAVATSKPLVFAEPLLGAVGLHEFFEACAGPGLGAAAEDKAVTIATALERVGTRRAVMIGDRALDVVAAHRCALPAVAVTWGIGSLGELSSVEPDAIATLPDELPAVIEELL
jgi:phosphoglycolate phosphatase